MSIRRRRYRASLRLATALLLAAGASVPAHAQEGARVLHYEPIQPTLQLDAVVPGQQKGSADAQSVTFDAFGQRFHILLDDNERLSPLLQSKSRGSPTLRLYRGELPHAAGSWARLAVAAGEVRGMVWTGSDLLVIESAVRLGDALVTPDDTAGTVIFRLADTVFDSNASWCATAASAPHDGASAYLSLVGELKNSPALMQAGTATVRLDVSALSDAQFLSHLSRDAARDEMLVRLNNVDGIFSAQLGVEIRVSTAQALDEIRDPFSRTTQASQLLDELGQVRRRSTELRTSGLTHLFTGRKLDGTTVGIAYLDSICDDQHSVGLTEATDTGNHWMDSLIAAHEIGHNFGAVHDGEGVCASTPQYRFLMSPSVHSSRDTFSQCSINSMQSRIQGARCISALPPPDLLVPPSLGEQRHAPATSFEWQLPIVNDGGSPALNSRATIVMPPALLIEEAFVPGGTCTSGGGTIQCVMGDVPGGATRTVHMTLRGTTLNSHPVSVAIGADNDSRTSNNSSSGVILIQPEADVGIAFTDPLAAASQQAEMNFAVINLAADAVSNVIVDLLAPADVTLTSLSLPGAECVLATNTGRCTLTTLPAGVTLTGAVQLNAPMAGIKLLTAEVTGDYIDPNPDNDSARHSLQLIGMPPVEQQASSPATTRGGGGSLGTLSFVLLASFVSLTRRKPRLTAQR